MESGLTTQASRSERTAATEFTSFPRLPPELRLKIWKLAIPNQRVVQLQGDGLSDNLPLGVLTLREDVPAMISVSREARSVALKFYTMISITATRQRFYFSTDRDILCFTTELPFCLFSDMVSQREWNTMAREISNIMLVEDTPVYEFKSTYFLVSEFRELESLTCVIRDGETLNERERDELRVTIEESFKKVQLERFGASSSGSTKKFPSIIIQSWRETESWFKTDT
jgi:hypothetical protein